MTSSAGRACRNRSDTAPSARTGRMARAESASSTAAAAPFGNWQASGGRTARRSTAHAIRAVCAGTRGSLAHIAPKATSSSGFLACRPP
ncbi:hypothetical protein [Streptomyces mirabilis]|uniref:hypothetical protein n=1 Tax=Streptomyces mirabilis TaxID=68239 RepID=UPI0036A70251